MQQRLLQLDPPWFLITPRGPGRGLVLISNGMDANMEVLIRHDKDGSLYNALTSEIRILDNPMMNDPEVPEFEGRNI